MRGPPAADGSGASWQAPSSRTVWEDASGGQTGRRHTQPTKNTDGEMSVRLSKLEAAIFGMADMSHMLRQ
eukprot:6954618-Prorocentrum_lima.AAC.1